MEPPRISTSGENWRYMVGGAYIRPPPKIGLTQTWLSTVSCISNKLRPSIEQKDIDKNYFPFPL